MSQQTDILIVGAGPAGLSISRALANSTLRLTIIDPQSAETLANPPFDGREIALTHPSKNLLETLNIWQHIPEDQIHPLRQAKVQNGNTPPQLHFPTPKTNRSGQPIDTLGYLVSNHLIRQSAYQACQHQQNLHWHLQDKVIHATSTAQQASVTLESGKTLHAKLLIAADSRLSQVRRSLGIATDLHDFGRTVIVFRLSHTQTNQHTAQECFFYGSTLALLPLTPHLTNCVITLDSRHAATIQNLTPDQLAQHVSEQINHRLGQMTLASTIHHYPLLGVHARQFHAQRSALIGDAACGMHPVTAHGFNLGLQSQAILSRLILRQHAQGKDIGHPTLLKQYNRQHQRNTRPLYHGTNLLVKLFTNDTPPAQHLRHTLLNLSNHLPPLKKLITRQLTG